ncbi:MAG: Rid family hydrolase, partial [Ensifer adhaerens]
VGDVLVIERRDDDRHACWGAILTAAARSVGIVGVVIDGFVTDAGAIRAAGLPVWCKGRSPVTTKAGRNAGEVNGEIVCAGVAIRAGDLVLADENGVCILPPDRALELARASLRLQAGEPDLIARLKAGEAVLDVLPLPPPDEGTDGTESSLHQADEDGVVEVPVITEALRRLGGPVSALARAAGLLFTCGMPPFDVRTGTIVDGGIEAQTEATLEALEHTLRRVGAGLHDIVKVNVFITDATLTKGFNAVYRARFGRHLPVRTTVTVSPWLAKFNIEIECVAVDKHSRNSWSQHSGRL